MTFILRTKSTQTKESFMPVISFANSKGGSGKTTSALLLACSLAETKPTTIIDADPRHPITAWAEKSGVPENLTVITTESEKSLLSDIETAAAKDPFVIIDLEGTGSRMMTYAVSQSDLVVIPLKEQQQDAMAALDVIQEIHQAMKVAHRKIPYAALFTQTRAAVKSRTARHIGEQFRSNEAVPMFETEIVERDAYAALFSIGGTVRNMSPKKVNGLKNAIGNIDAFHDEVIAKLRGLKSDAETKKVT